MTNIEDLLRDTLRAREGDISVAPRFDAARVPSPREAPSRTSWFGPPWRMAGAGAAILAVVATGFALNSTLTGPDPSEPAEPTERVELVGAVVPPPTGMQAVSSLGIEILVPADWSINDTHCRQTSGPTVVRGRSMGYGDCYTPEPADKDIAVIGASDMDWLPSQLTQPHLNDPDASPGPVPTIEMQITTVHGRPAERGVTELPDGRTAGLLRFPQDDVAVAVRARDADIVATILDSARPLEVDSAGCPAVRPDALEFIAQSTDDPLATLDAVESASLCSYPVWLEQTRLGSSVVIDGPDLASLVTAVRGLTFDGTIDTSCTDPRPVPAEDVVMAFRLADGSIRYLVLAEYGCDTVAIAASHPDHAAITRSLPEVLGRILYGGPPFVQ